MCSYSAFAGAIVSTVLGLGLAYMGFGVWALHDKMPGEIWEIDEIQKVADHIHAYGFDMDVVESVNVHDDIKIGLPLSLIHI